MEKVFKGFKGEDVRPVTSCKFLPHLQSQGTALWGRGYIPGPCLRTSAWEATCLCTQGIIVEPSITLISVPQAHARWTRAAILSRKPSYSSE